MTVECTPVQKQICNEFYSLCYWSPCPDTETALSEKGSLFCCVFLAVEQNTIKKKKTFNNFFYFQIACERKNVSESAGKAPGILELVGFLALMLT